ncbi:MAG: DUF4296 domain-containing protein [Flavobacteriales bacterium]|nr:DUF4296 domain-containing protein [Flavobacteriales bacterium]
MKWHWPLLLLLAACGEDPSGPPDLIDRATFTAILVEAQVIEAEVERGLVLDSSRTPVTEARYDELITRFGVSKEQFRSSFDHYASDPELLKAIYEDVVVELSRQKDGAN